MKIVVDSYAWIEIFKASAAGGVAKGRIEESDESFTPDLVLAELAWKYLREGEESERIRRWLRSISEATQIVPVDITVAEESAKAFLELLRVASNRGLPKPGLADAIILAMARLRDAKVLTGDRHFEGLSETSWLA